VSKTQVNKHFQANRQLQAVTTDILMELNEYAAGGISKKEALRQNGEQHLAFEGHFQGCLRVFETVSMPKDRGKTSKFVSGSYLQARIDDTQD